MHTVGVLNPSDARTAAAIDEIGNQQARERGCVGIPSRIDRKRLGMDERLLVGRHPADAQSLLRAQKPLRWCGSREDDLSRPQIQIPRKVLKRGSNLHETALSLARQQLIANHSAIP